MTILQRSAENKDGSYERTAPIEKMNHFISAASLDKFWHIEFPLIVFTLQ